ncbi:hypothetical protein CC86DRAFT_103058 [Ophiobolus disseminans]|uniref:Uncharacterized protein n=1 Tax=Ophiobolus disseminans TaxID=1469910 RepID=A0A6A6ZK84_9PLEO|nr:hypothetical protein CC86DRAFT_103058 [Ophiobolus disseminans]
MLLCVESSIYAGIGVLCLFYVAPFVAALNILQAICNRLLGPPWGATMCCCIAMVAIEIVMTSATLDRYVFVLTMAVPFGCMVLIIYGTALTDSETRVSFVERISFLGLLLLMWLCITEHNARLVEGIGRGG